MKDQTTRAAIGIDLGGTAIKAGLVCRDGAVPARQGIATEAGGGVDHVLGRIAGLIGAMRRHAADLGVELEAVGVGMPGTLSHRAGVVFAPPNLPGWRNVPVVERLRAATGMNVVMENDANCAALGEFVCGAGRGVRNLVLLTLGTGIGGGIILDGRLWRGSNENAGEIGHQIVQLDGRPCNCGQRGCLEAYASASQTAARAVEAIRSGQASVLRALVDGGRPLTSEDVVQASQAGDELARRVWEETCRYLAVSCLNIQHGWAPDCIVLAGGMSGAGELLRRPILEAMDKLASKLLGPLPDVRLARLGNDAGFIGAALGVLLEPG